MAFGVIVPEASAPAFGIRQATSATTCRIINPLRRVAMMATIQRFNQDPIGWLQKFSSAATIAGGAAIERLLSTLPDGVARSLRGNAPLPSAAPGNLCRVVEMHQVRLTLAVNLRQIHEFCLKLDGSA